MNQLRGRALSGNPLLAHHQRVSGSSRLVNLEELTAEYSFAVPSEEALRAIVAASPAGVMELGAGMGYWARLLSDRGADVVALDRFPPPSSRNRWFAGMTPWYEVGQGDEAVVALHPHRTLLLVWPTRDEEWAADAARTHHRSGGTTLVYVGEPPGGRTGDDQLHALVGHYDCCLACRHGLVDLPCICGIDQHWELEHTVALPHWDGSHDDLHVYGRVDPPRSFGDRRRLSRRRFGRRPRH